MIVTLMTDASHCPKTDCAGFGFWLASNRGRLCGGKPINSFCGGSYLAEFKGVANSLHLCIKAGMIASGDKVIVQLDNTSVVNPINKKQAKRGEAARVLDFILKLVKKNHIKIECRHVKAHTNRVESRYYANNYCDVTAKRNMRMARSQFLGHSL